MVNSCSPKNGSLRITIRLRIYSFVSFHWIAIYETLDASLAIQKCHFSTVNLSCFILVTDTKTVWTEVLNSKQFARRWRSCNPNSAPDFSREEDEDEWRSNMLELLSKAHTLGGVEELTFDVVESHYADLALELECETFQWRWETCLQGGRFSAEMISRHLVLPLISLNHLAFTSAVGESDQTDLEKAVDKVGRTARRSVDTHLKNSLSKPRVATALRRITAIFNFENTLPPIQLSTERPELQAQVLQEKHRELSPKPSPVPFKRRSPSPDRILPAPSKTLPSRNPTPSPKVSKIPVTAEDSATEDDSDDEAPPVAAAKGRGRDRSSAASPPAKAEPQIPAPRAQSSSPVPSKPSKPLSRTKPPSSDSDSSPVRPPVKKTKPPASSSDEDSEAERKRRLAKATKGAGGAAARGTRQPIKRGGKRF
ncbi:hypothetical protein MSAN_00380200 [Mycena sanguinolenta]|uniref:XLF-like N-terminal domain-containing protein n=1 Tax=Mycena sanguinolenta TaxID=230812 RepID=A0A8H6ZDK5_9AGAR|nr:hypothetical protein MSAN_00380200 [Mycena sanguinolenta]